MFVISEPVFPRLRIEKIFRFLYAIGTLLLFAALVITLASYVHRLDQTYASYSGGSAELSTGLKLVLAGCSFSEPYNLGGLETTAAMSETGAPFAFLSHSMMIVGAIVIMFFILINDIVAKLCFAGNVRNVRVRGLSVPINTIAANAMLIQSLGLIVLVAASSPGRTFLNNYVKQCTVQFATNNFATFVALENNIQSVFGTNLSLIVIAVALNLGVYVLGFVALCVEGFTDAAAEFENRKYFWEEPPFGIPDKKELFHYSRWRRFALDEIEQGREVNLAPVSYLEFMRDLEDAKANWMDDAAMVQGGIPGLYASQSRSGSADAFEPSGGGGEFAANPWRIDDGAGEGDEAEELVLPEGFGAAGAPLGPRAGMTADGYAPRSAAPPPPPMHDDDDDDGGQYHHPHPERFDAPYHQQHQQGESSSYQDRPYDASQQQQPRIQETEEERRERHRLRRENESAEERAQRKERRRRAKEMAQLGVGSPNARRNNEWDEDATGGGGGRARYGLTSGRGAIPPPAPSP